MQWTCGFSVLYHPTIFVKNYEHGYAKNLRRKDLINMNLPLFIVVGIKDEKNIRIFSIAYYYVLRYTLDGQPFFIECNSKDISRYMYSSNSDLNDYEKTLLFLNNI